VSSRKLSGLSAATSVIPASRKKLIAGLLPNQIAGEPRRGFDDNRAHTIGRDARQHGGETGPDVDGITALDRVVRELSDELVAAGSPGES
jgi:hypothetical protein